MRIALAIALPGALLAACTATPIPIPGSDLGYHTPPVQEAGYGGKDSAPSPPSRFDVDGTKGLCDLCPPGNWCGQGGDGPCGCDGAPRDGGGDALGEGLARPELGPGELGTKDAGPPDQASDAPAVKDAPINKPGS